MVGLGALGANCLYWSFECEESAGSGDCETSAVCLNFVIDGSDFLDMQDIYSYELVGLEEFCLSLSNIVLSASKEVCSPSSL